MSHRRSKRIRQALRQTVADTLGATPKVAKAMTAHDIQHRQVYRRVKRHVSANRATGERILQGV